MISLNDVLLAMSNIPVDDPIAEIWGRGLQGGYKIIEYTGSLPITITANGDVLLDYRIYGADGGAGEPTENLFDKNTITPNTFLKSDGTFGSTPLFSVSDFIPVENGDYFINNARSGYSGPYHCVYDENKNFVRSIVASISDMSIIIGDNEKYIRISVNSSNDSLNRLNVCMVVKGTTAPTKYEPYGYKLPMSIPSSENLLNRKNSVGGKYLVENGNEGTQSNFAYTDFLKVNASIPYTIKSYDNTLGGAAAMCFYDANFDFLYGITYYSRREITFTPETNVAYVRCSYKSADRVSLSLGSTAPTTYEPYSEITTPVYIGENQLGAGEYVSFSEQKIYRDVSGTLTPTDPPVTLPSIPTIDGTTVIDYDGDPKPSQVYVKYKGKSDGA